MRAILTGLLAMVLPALAACGSGSGDEGASNDANGDLFVAQPAAALAASADKFEGSVTSVQADFSFDMSMAGVKMGMDGDFAYRAPDSMHMKMSMSGGEGGFFGMGDAGDFEIIALGDEFYMNSAFTGWIKFSLSEMGADGKSFRDLLSSHSPLDYRALLEASGGTIEDLGEDGGNQHMRLTMDMGDLMTALDSFGSDENGTIADAFGGVDIDGPITLDVWVDLETLLPQKFVADADFGTEGKSTGFKMEVNFHDYNGSIEIPEPPADAKSLSDMFGGFGADADGDTVPDALEIEGN